MKDTLFFRIFTAVLATALVLTVAHTIYILYAYGHTSIIYFIGKELW